MNYKEKVIALLNSQELSKEQKEKLESIFPELSESEDERIRKEILDYIIKGSESLYDVQQYGKEKFEKWIAWLEKQKIEKQGKQNPAWSEEDERMYRGLHNLIYSTPYCDSRKELSDWLESIKDRVQLQSTWSEEDEKIYQSIMDDTVQENQLNSNQTNWLRDIKYRYFPQSKQKWSEEDEKILNYLLWFYDTRFRWNDTCCDDIKFGDIVTFLKSLKDRVQPKQEIE